MSSEIILPELAESMTSATLTTWLKQPGDSVRSGEPVAEVETDKTTVEIEAPTDGILDPDRGPSRDRRCRSWDGVGGAQGC